MDQPRTHAGARAFTARPGRTDLPPGVRPGEVFTVERARRAGYSRARIRHLKGTGRWRRVLGQMLMDTSRAMVADDRVVAAVATWPEGVVGMRVAAAWHGLPVAQRDRVEMYTPRHRRPTADLLPLRAALATADVERRAGVGHVVTTRERTIVDCLALLPRGEAESLWAFAISRSLFDHDQLIAAIAERLGRPGVVQLRAIARFAEAGAANPAERRLQDLLDRAGLTGWVAGERVLDESGRVVARPDILFAREKVIVELDGQGAHGPGQFQRDRTRQNALLLLGYVVLRVTWEDVTRRPEVVVAMVRRALAR